MSVRLNKLLAQRGLGARRKCDLLIQSGVVRVNGRVVTAPGVQVEPDRDRVEIRGRPLPARARSRYYVLHKPVGVITTLDDPEGRKSLRHLLPPGTRLFPVGRLDADTSGLLILTNDGELAHRLMHPRYGVEKIYRVRLAHLPSPAAIARLRAGFEYEPGSSSAPARVRILRGEPGPTGIEISIREGRNRQVRRMCEALGLKVMGLHRAGYGPLRLGPLARGMWRELSSVEVARLRAVSARPHARAPRPRPSVGRRGPERSDRDTAPTRGGPPRRLDEERAPVITNSRRTRAGRGKVGQTPRRSERNSPRGTRRPVRGRASRLRDQRS